MLARFNLDSEGSTSRRRQQPTAITATEIIGVAGNKLCPDRVGCWGPCWRGWLRRLLNERLTWIGGATMKSSDRRATAELLIAIVEAAIARGCRHYNESGELLATTLAVLESLQRDGFVTVEEPARRRSTPAPAAGTP